MASADERQGSLSCLYEANYVTMIISLNAMRPCDSDTKLSNSGLRRPEIICAGLLMKARGLDEPGWWNTVETQRWRQEEIDSLSVDVDWRFPAAKLLGLDSWPKQFDSLPSVRESKKSE